MNYQGLGNGQDGVLTISSNTTESPIDSSAVGSASSDSLTATNPSFASGQLVLIHQTIGSGAGSYELNFIKTYVAGTITTLFPLLNSYSCTGTNKAQVRVVPQYSKVTINTGITYTAKAWDGSVGGIMAIFCNGVVDIVGTITATGKGYRGGASPGTGPGLDGYQGESELGAGVRSYLKNGSAGGGGDFLVNQSTYGGGAGHATAGQTGPNDNNGAEGQGGDTIGNSALSLIFFGGSGGSGSTGNDGSSTVGAGGNGGGIIFIAGAQIIVSGTVVSNGNAGANAGLQAKPSGGGAGGSILFRTPNAIIGSSLVSASGGAGGDGAAIAGGNGRIRIESCNLSGSTTLGSVSYATGGHEFCQSFIHIY